MTKHQTYSEDVRGVGKFEKYAKDNHLAWAEFARCEGLGEVNPVLVTGVDRTKDFAMMCYSDYDDEGLECQFRTLASGSASNTTWGTWETTRPVYKNQGPQSCFPPTQTINPTSAGDNNAETVSDGFDQCVFIRYISVRSRRLWVPKIIKAAAGPHDLNTGGRDGEGSPLQAMYDSGSGSDISSCSSNDDGDNDMSSVTSVGSESDIVIHNPTTVRYLSSSSIRFF